MIEVITNYEKFRSLKSSWNQLLENSSEHENVFLRHEWFQSWWQAFGSEKTMFILVHYSNNHVVGIAPLMLFRDKYKIIPYNRLGFIEDANAPSMNFIISNDREKEVVSSIIRYLLTEARQYWHVAILNKITDNSSTLELCKRFLSNYNAKYLVRTSQNSPYIETNGDYEKFLSTTSTKFRKQLRNKFNKLQKTGEVAFEVHREVGNGGSYLQEAINVSSKSWKHGEGTSMAATQERRKFFENLSKEAGKNGSLRIWLMRLNGNPIAMEYHLEYKGRTHAMRGDFDESFSHLSPGSALEAYIIKHCFVAGLSEYDFCGLPYGYKVKWTKLLHRRSNTLFYSPKPFSRVLYLVQKYLPLMRSKWLDFEQKVS